MTPMKSNTPGEAHREFNDAMKEVLGRFENRLGAMEMLAVASHLVGVLVALQDQNKVTPAMAMELVASNIQVGNAEALNCIENPEGNA